MTTTIPYYLDSKCSAEICYDPNCPEAVKPNNETGRYFITINHPGFNSSANNRDGYATIASATSAIRRYGRLGGHKCDAALFGDDCAICAKINGR